jgi:hypothetical protein
MRLKAILVLFALAMPAIVVASESIVRQFVDAYNSQDLETMLSFCDDNVRWLAIEDDAVEIATNGKDELRSALQADSVPKCSVSIYKTVAGQITEVLYFPAWVCDASEPPDK